MENKVAISRRPEPSVRATIYFTRLFAESVQADLRRDMCSYAIFRRSLLGFVTACSWCKPVSAIRSGERKIYLTSVLDRLQRKCGVLVLNLVCAGPFIP